jgi:ubiquinone biosynthesis protein Coq4
VPPGLASPEATYLILRVRQTHDLWHVLTGYETDESGEIALQAFTYAQLRVPSALWLGGLGALRQRLGDPDALRRARAAYRRGLATAKLIPFSWEDHWGTPLAALRATLHCPPHEVSHAH